jgi:hypothetical protein
MDAGGGVRPGVYAAFVFVAATLRRGATQARPSRPSAQHLVQGDEIAQTGHP